MFRFEDPIYLYLLIFVPILVALRMLGLRIRKKLLAKFCEPALLKQLMLDL